MISKKVIEQEIKTLKLEKDCLLVVEVKNGQLQNAVCGNPFKLMSAICEVIMGINDKCGLTIDDAIGFIKQYYELGSSPTLTRQDMDIEKIMKEKEFN